MDRTEAMELRDLARTVAAPMSTEEAESSWRTFLIRHATEALDTLTARDAMLDPVGTRALWELHDRCFVCHRAPRRSDGTIEHDPLCELS